MANLSEICEETLKDVLIIEIISSIWLTEKQSDYF